MDSIQTAKAISFRESQSELLLDLAMQASAKSHELTETARAQTDLLIASVGQAAEKTSRDLEQVLEKFDQSTALLPAQILDALRLELASLTGEFSHRLESASTRALTASIDQAGKGLDELASKAGNISLPGENKKLPALLATVALACSLVSVGAGFAAAKAFPAKPSPEVTRQLEAGADLLRVWDDLPNATRDDLIKRFSKR